MLLDAQLDRDRHDVSADCRPAHAATLQVVKNSRGVAMEATAGRDTIE
jgi:hypothetical protein